MTDAEVVVYGATSGGVCASVSAARCGVDVALIEPGHHVGGMVSGGLGYTDLGDPGVLGGMAAEFMYAVADYYDVASGTYAGPEPHVAELLFRRWLEQCGVRIFFGEQLATVESSAGAITALTTSRGHRHTGGVFVDASYEGDLLAAAGIPYAVGRESQDLYGERFAGRREPAPGKHQFPAHLSPFADDATVLPLIHDRPPVPVGAGDGGVMAYGYRVCLSPAADRIPFAPSANYEPDQWELGRRYLHWFAQHNTPPRPQHFLGMVANLPNGKCDGNSIGPFSFNLLDGSNWDYPDAEPTVREQLRLRHLQHTQDFLYFLAHDPEVPSSLREEMASWGLPADEFGDTGGLPHQLYVREARRMRGEYVLTEPDLLPTPARQYDAVAMGSYHIDIREVQRTWRWVYEHPDPIPAVFNEGYLSVGVAPYPIPYRCLVPRYRDCSNLIVPVCISASHVAFASVRMEVQYEMLGHAAGVAATYALRDDRPVQQVDIGALQQTLHEQGQVLAL